VLHRKFAALRPNLQHQGCSRTLGAPKGRCRLGTLPDALPVARLRVAEAAGVLGVAHASVFRWAGSLLRRVACYEFAAFGAEVVPEVPTTSITKLQISAMRNCDAIIDSRNARASAHLLNGCTWPAHLAGGIVVSPALRSSSRRDQS
jgi:hypothetical protein